MVNLPQTFVLFYSNITNMHLATSLGSEMANLLQHMVKVPKHTHYPHHQTQGHHMMQGRSLKLIMKIMIIFRIR
jgi:hypothetical protein